METFTFQFKPTRIDAEIQELQFRSNYFFVAIARFYKNVSTHHPDFILTQIRDQYGNEFYSGVLHPDGVAQSKDCVRSGGPA